MTKISKLDAYRLAKKAGADFDKDVYAQKICVLSDIAAIARLAGYRKPKSTSGLMGRYFFEHLDNLRKKRGWK